ncbi:prepilin-type N-terminal cleavage/methylation domain-containing protein [uncultured Cellulomonas sp.]|uniref:prepilin-type N-terminal cleavage/methylation domain-containing protein n=1 Tax=uncultured Cellulomonas sp. TaxID=189682 RepID=UPI0028EF055B|nr:prepilin-type N-terminal cleavage/methylation domain-containing protein [uncultured Cellulomonas sp.]
MVRRRHTGRRLRSDESGFTLAELLVAMMIISGVLLGLMAVQTSALVTTAQTRQRAQGTAVANQVMEQMRALPWASLSKGMHASFASAAGGDPNVTSSQLHPVADPSITEPLVTSTDQTTDRAPLSGAGGSNKTVEADPSIPGFTYTSRAYVTRSAQTAANVLTLTVITSWRANQTTTQKHVILRSQAFAPTGGCGDASNQPYLGACQALLSGDAGATGPTVTVAAAGAGPTGPVTTPTTPIIPGTEATVATLSVGTAGVGLTSQQATAVEATATHGGLQTLTADAAVAAVATGGGRLTNSASNDAGSAGAAPANPADVTGVGSASPLTVSGTGMSLQLVPASGTSANLRATTTVSCATGVPAGQACAASDLTGGGASSVVLTTGGTPFTVASVAGGGSAKTLGARFTSAAGTTAVGCAALSGPGCLGTSVKRTVGLTSVGQGPWTGGAAPSGLASVTSYTDATLVERGLSQRTTAGVTTRTGTVSYWNGSGYSTLTIDRLTSTTLVTPAVTTTVGGVTVSASATVTVTPAMSIASHPDPVGCSGQGCSVTSDTGTLTLTVTYVVTSGGIPSAFTAAASVGSGRASAAFKAAPSA